MSEIQFNFLNHILLSLLLLLLLLLSGLQIRVHIEKLFISHPTHMLWVLKRTVSMRWLF